MGARSQPPAASGRPRSDRHLPRPRQGRRRHHRRPPPRHREAWAVHDFHGRRLAVSAQSNEHVDALNDAIQSLRRRVGDIDERLAIRVAGTETASPGDVVVTRRNDRNLRTDRDEPIRNRELWLVQATHDDGSLTVSRVDGHGTATLPAEYVQEHVRLGYAATAHGLQGDTADASVTLVSGSTSHRNLYVGATRGRDENRLHVVTEEPSLAEARDVLERALTNDMVDVPAVVRRQELAQQVRDAVPVVAAAQEQLRRAKEVAAPLEHAVSKARQDLQIAEFRERTFERCLDEAGRGDRRRYRKELAAARTNVHGARERLDEATAGYEPARDAVDEASALVREAEAPARLERIVARLDRMELSPPSPGIEHGIDRGVDRGIDIGW